MEILAVLTGFSITGYYFSFLISASNPNRTDTLVQTKNDFKLGLVPFQIWIKALINVWKRLR